MKTKASIFFSLIFFLCIHADSFAQKSDSEKVKYKIAVAVEKLSEVFKLDKTQQNNIESIFTDFYTSQQKLKNDIQGPASGLRQGFAKQDFQSVRKKNDELIAEREKRLKKQLSEEQYKKWTDDIEPSLHKHKKH